MNEQMDKLMADYEQLKNSIFNKMDSAAHDAYFAKTSSRQVKCIAIFSVLQEIVEEAGLFTEYTEWKENVK